MPHHLVSSSGQMDWVLLFLVQVLSWQTVSALFTVEAERRSYEAEFGGAVIMGCHFQPLPSKSNPGPKVIWHRVIPGPSLEVYQFDDGAERLASQDPAYRGRVSMLTEELDKGSAKLQVTNLRMNDSGTYRCLVQMGGADYKLFTLSVNKAPYKEVIQRIHKSADGHEVELTCQSEGYPPTVVTWRDGNHRGLTSRTTNETTSDQLFKVISQINVSSSDRNNYTCTIGDEGPSATFNIPDVISTPPPKRNGTVIMSCACVTLAVIAAVVVMLHYRRQKALRDNGVLDSSNILADIERDPTDATACLQIRDHGKEENRQDEHAAGSGNVTFAEIEIKNMVKKKKEKPAESDEFTLYSVVKPGTATAPGDCVETLREVLKDRYAELSTNRRVTQSWTSLCQKELPGRLQNSEGQPVDPHVLLQESKETLLLEGPPGSGKSTIVEILASSWALQSGDRSSSLQGFSSVHLLLLLDCSKVEHSLFQEIMTQLSLEVVSTENVLKTLLTGPTKVLLLLDGYREGIQVFDESLMGFLKEKQGCRVLVTACPEHCPELKERVGTRGQLTLQ